jgi:phosphatidylglycerophosphate synthase
MDPLSAATDPSPPVERPASLRPHTADMFTRLFVDPVAVPIARGLSRLRGVTPNRITLAAGAIAVASAVCFANGQLRIGGGLFILRFYVDCLDGTVARIQGSTSRRGAALDLFVDVTGISACAASLGWHLVDEGRLPVAIALFLMASIVVYNWLLAYRKQLAERLGEGGDGGGRQGVRTSLPILRSWLAFARRLDMSPVPYAIEAEIVSFGLVPLLASERIAGKVLWGTLAFYTLASLVNLRRTWGIAGRIDRQEKAARAR